MRAVEFTKQLQESSDQVSLSQLYNGNCPDRDESFWDEVATNGL
jgi:hypothetical protein